jgi:hypothetical protein
MVIAVLQVSGFLIEFVSNENHNKLTSSQLFIDPIQSAGTDSIRPRQIPRPGHPVVILARVEEKGSIYGTSGSAQSDYFKPIIGAPPLGCSEERKLAPVTD